MPDFTEAGLWIATLAERQSDPDGSVRERFRNAHLQFRDRAKFLASEIARDLPEFTNHDLAHLDALWELATLICGPGYGLTPAEGFVLGGAFLVHDLGMGLAAYPGGLTTLKKEPMWLDLVASRLRTNLGRCPTQEELSNPGPQIELVAKAETLRFMHASRAEYLALTSWVDSKSGEAYHLIDDVDIRLIYGKLIGRIAHSHWWPVSGLRHEFRESLGAAPFAPHQWTVDPLKIAAILRVADISHLDTSRAPGFSRAVRKPAEPSRAHWVFQEYLQKPQLKDGRILFTATRPFPIEESAAWWLCLETLKNVHEELQRTDALLADESRNRFVARGVAGVEDPKRMTEWIPTDGWLPINAMVRATSVPRLVRNLGGEGLYGQDQTIPLRELIQNSSDAIGARRILDNQPNWGRIVVSMGRDDDKDWIEVEDDGVGMSEEVLCGTLLDFGNDYWGSPAVPSQFPGLLSKGFAPIGKYGIGFFSVFMWGDRVRVTTRRFEDARKDTKVLEFTGGPESRPILRNASPAEYLRDGGTKVRVWLTVKPTEPGGVLHSIHNLSEYGLQALCTWVAPALDADIFVQNPDGQIQKVASASDWKTIGAEELLRRCLVFNSGLDSSESREILGRLSKNVRPMLDPKGEVLGRCCILPYYFIPGFHSFSEPGGFGGCVTVGGLRSNPTLRLAGLLKGFPVSAARDEAMPLVGDQELSSWASEQARLATNISTRQEDLLQIADVVAQCRGDLLDLPICFFGGKAISGPQLSSMRDLPNELLVISDDTYGGLVHNFPELVWAHNVLAVRLGMGGVLEMRTHRWPWRVTDRITWNPLLTNVANSLAAAWDCPLKPLLETILGVEDSAKPSRHPIATVNGSPILRDALLLRRSDF